MAAKSPLPGFDKEALPREKALREGIKSLSDRELMAIIFGTGIQGKNVLELCQDIICDNNGHLSQLLSMEPAEIVSRYKGVGIAKALNLLAALELGVRVGADAIKISKPVFSSSRNSFEFMKDVFYNVDHEEFWVVLLNRANHLIKRVRISQGGLAATVVDARIIIREAILSKASSIILFHNHPSGNLTASAQDIALTKKLKDAANYFDINVLDHLIIHNDRYYSFCDDGRMP